MGSAADAVAVVVPAYQAAASVGNVVQGIRRAASQALIIVVDDGSHDETAKRASDAGATVVRHAENQGKGRALALGLQEALKRPTTLFIVTLDADGQHPPKLIPALLDPLLTGAADLVVGARPRDPAVMPLGRRCTNWLSSTLVSRVTGTHLPDSQSGFRAMTRPVAAVVRPAGARYEFETEFLFEAARRGFRIGSVPVPVVYDGATSHFHYFADTMRLSAVFARHWRDIVFPPHAARRTPHGLSA